MQGNVVEPTSRLLAGQQSKTAETAPSEPSTPGTEDAAALDRDPPSAKALSGMAEQAARPMEPARPADTLKTLTSALREQESSELWNDWARAALACGDPGLAESGYRRALELEPSHRQAAINLAALLLAQGRRDDVIPILCSSTGRQLTADEARALQHLAERAQMAKQPDTVAGSTEGSTHPHDPAAGTDTRPGASDLPASVIIPVWNQLQYTRQCVAALQKNTADRLYELIFIDNGSTDGTPEFLSTLEGNVRILRNPENRGFGNACNQGADLSRRPYLVFLNNDTAPHPGWLEALLALAKSDPAIGAVGSKLLFPDGRLQEAGARVSQDGSGWPFGRGGDAAAAIYNRPCEVDYCSGAALLVRREAFQKLGGFDPQFAPAYYEDTDLCFGLRNLGLKVMYCPASQVTHFESKTAGLRLDTGLRRYLLLNRPKFAAKWAKALARHDPSPASTRHAEFALAQAAVGQPMEQDRHIRPPSAQDIFQPPAGGV
jgi:GT2 family glycosyltransferase